MAEFTQVASVTDVPDGSGTCVEVNGKRIALFNVGGEFFALGDTCTHDGGPLSEGEVDPTDLDVICPWHQACFNLKTGKVTSPPADEDVQPYPVRISGDAVEIQV